MVDEIGWSELIEMIPTSLKVCDYFLQSVLQKADIVTNIVEQLFVKGWRHRKKARPDIQYIFKVLWPEPALEPFLNYRYIYTSLSHRHTPILDISQRSSPEHSQSQRQARKRETPFPRYKPCVSIRGVSSQCAPLWS